MASYYRQFSSRRNDLLGLDQELGWVDRLWEAHRIPSLPINCRWKELEPPPQVAAVVEEQAGPVEEQVGRFAAQRQRRGRQQVDLRKE